MKTAEKFTPGPWELDAYGNILGGESMDIIAERVIQSVHPDDYILPLAEQQANAALIAAAPDLLRELKHLVGFMEPVEQTGLNIPGLATLNGAREAIKKAEGK